MITLEQIQKRLICILKECGLNQSEIARRLGVSSQSINNYMRGVSLPALDTLANLCDVLEIDPAEILGTQRIASME